MKEKCFFALLIIFFILILGACTNLQAKNDPMSILSTSNTTIEDNQESVSSQPTEVDTSGDVYEELALNDHHHIQANVQGEEYTNLETSVYKGYKQDKIEMRGDRAEMSDFPLYLNTVAGGLDRRDQTIGGFSFVVKIYAVPVVEIIG